MPPSIHVPQRRGLHKVRIFPEGAEVEFILDGKRVFRAHWQQALAVGKSLVEQAMAARQFEEALSKKQ